MKRWLSRIAVSSVAVFLMGLITAPKRWWT
jgi:hypothetical protein